MKVLQRLFVPSILIAAVFLSGFAQTPTPTPTPSADLYPTGLIDVLDLFSLSEGWKKETDFRGGDINGDGRCGAEDLLRLLGDWHSTTTIDMVTIPAGSFLMGNSGSARDQSFSGYEEPRHEVTINYSFQMGRYEVTNAQYAEVLNWAKVRGYLSGYSGGVVRYDGQGLLYFSGPVCYINYSGSQFHVEARNGESLRNHPVSKVTWYGAVSFCNWASEREGLSVCYDLSDWELTNPHSGGYRLPSESEWEYACRGSSLNPNRYAPFSFGDDVSLTDLSSCQFSSLFNQYVVWCGNDDGWTEAVGSKLPNDYGLHDMHGNLFEWCQDWWRFDYDEAPQDGSAWSVQLPSDPLRVLRGGCYSTFVGNCRSAHRHFAPPPQAGYAFGFRVARTPQ